MDKRAKSPQYILGHQPDEAARLTDQATLLHDDRLDRLVSQAESCLEIGCGVGSVYNQIRNASKSIHYLGVDISPEAIRIANENFEAHGNTRFQVMSGNTLSLPDNSFDLVVIKLVLWSLGEQALSVIREARRVLRPGGTIYSFEPDTQLLFFSPEKRHTRRIIALWEDLANQGGSDHECGRKVHALLHQAGFAKISTRAFCKTYSGLEPEGYRATASNLKRLFTSPGASALNIPKGDPLLDEVQRELDLCRPEDLIFDGYFVNTGEKQA